MSLLPDARDAKVSLSASVPKEGIPEGNSFLVALSIFSLKLGTIKFSVLFAIKVFRGIPSITSIGSIMFPFDFDIF